MSDAHKQKIRMINCFECGAANSADYTHCRKCDAELKQGMDALAIPPWIAWGTIGLVVVVMVLIILAIAIEPLGVFIAIGLTIIAAILLTIGSFWILIEAFQESVLWGLACLFFSGIASFAFLFVHPNRALRPFALQLVGGVLLVIAQGLLAVIGV